MVFLPSNALALSKTFEVREVSHFAGRLGNRVERTVTVRENGKVVKVYVTEFHDRFRPFPKSPTDN